MAQRRSRRADPATAAIGWVLRTSLRPARPLRLAVVGAILGGLLLLPKPLLRAASPWPGILGGPVRAPKRAAPDGWLRFDIRDGATQAPMPIKLTLVGVDGTHINDRLGSTGCVVRHAYRASVETVKCVRGATGLGDVRPLCLPAATFGDGEK